MAAHAMTFDTLAFAKKLEASGIIPQQAEAVSEALKDVFDENLSPVIFTKYDGELLKIDFEHKLSKLKTELIIWVVGLLFAQTAIIVSIIKFLH